MQNKAYNDTVPYQRLHNIYVVLGIPRPLGYIQKIRSGAAWESISVQYQAKHDSYDMNHKVLYNSKKINCHLMFIHIHENENTDRRADHQ